MPTSYSTVHHLPSTVKEHTLTLSLSTPTSHTVKVINKDGTCVDKVDQKNPTLSLLIPSHHPLILHYTSTSFPKPSLNLLPLPPSAHTTLTNTPTTTTISTTKGFPSFHLPLTSSLPYSYTLKILTPGLAQIGFSTPNFSPNSEAGKGCGDDDNSYGFDGSRIFKWHSGGTRWGAPWSTGSIIKLGYDPVKGEIYCTVDGNFELGGEESVMFCGVFKDLRPCLTINKSCKLEVDFSTPTRNFNTVQEIITSERTFSTFKCNLQNGEVLIPSKPQKTTLKSTILTKTGPLKIHTQTLNNNQVSFGDITSKDFVNCYAKVKGTKLYKKPKSWKKVLNVTDSLSVYIPIPEEGYVAVGGVVRGCVEEGVEGVVCVREDWVVEGRGRGRTVEIEGGKREGSGTADASVYTLHVTPQKTFLISPYGSKTYQTLKSPYGSSFSPYGPNSSPNSNNVKYGSETMEILKGLKTSDSTLIQSIIDSLRSGVDEMLKLSVTCPTTDSNFIVIINLLTNLLRSKDLSSGFGTYLSGVTETIDLNCKKTGKFYASKHARKLIEMCIVGCKDPDFKNDFKNDFKEEDRIDSRINDIKNTGVRILSNNSYSNNYSTDAYSTYSAVTNNGNVDPLSNTLIRLYNSIKENPNNSFNVSDYWKLMSWFETVAVSTFREYGSGKNENLNRKFEEDVKVDGSKKIQVILDPRSVFNGGKITFTGIRFSKKEGRKTVKLVVDDTTNKKFYDTKQEFEGDTIKVTYTPDESLDESLSDPPVFSYIVHGIGIVNSYKLRKFLTEIDKHGGEIDEWDGVKETKRWAEKEDEGIIRWLNKNKEKKEGGGGRRHVFEMNVGLAELEGGNLGFLATGGGEMYGLRYRIACLLHFNEAVERTVHLIDIEDSESNSFGERLRSFGGRIAEEGKARRLKIALEATAGTGGNNTTVILDNFLASKSLDNVGIAGSNCIFVQAFKDLNKKPASVLRSVWDGDRVFQVSFRGESGSDAGGVFREGMQVRKAARSERLQRQRQR
ncbi:hypothetical protein TL16_g00007 [Triparma laevis f. inornata]|uniref:SPRY domain-containing protein n=1 Tax=Triparma laevis f. inornata TaxID=1714386 RepID=A0A9W7DM31_9STRA|nr:hypothetical protein TL16_g00007 [Triparma laevis f. inornata]